MEEEKVVESPAILRVTTPKEWAEKNLNVREIELPSGTVFRVKNIDLPTMVSRGILPLDLLQGFMKLVDTADRAELEKGHLGGLSEKDMVALDGVCRKFVTAAVLDPHVSDTEPTSEDVINVQDIEFNDVIFIFSQCVKGGGRQFAAFFRPTGNAVPVRSSGAGVRAKTVKSSRNK